MQFQQRVDTTYLLGGADLHDRFDPFTFLILQVLEMELLERSFKRERGLVEVVVRHRRARVRDSGSTPVPQRTIHKAKGLLSVLDSLSSPDKKGSIRLLSAG